MPYAQNVEFVGYNDLEGRPGFKLAIHEHAGRFLLYVAALWEPGWSIVDVTDPAQPSLVRFIEGPANTWTIQLQVADGRLITSLEAIPPGWGGEADTEPSEGFRIWSLDVPDDPQVVGEWRSGAIGTHRNYYAGGRYVHTATTLPGYDGYLYGIVDIDDVAAPRLVGRWWWPGQHVAGGESYAEADTAKLSTAKPFELGGHGGAFPALSLHAGPIVADDRAYCAWMRAGLVILDIADPTRPELVGSLPVHPPLGSSIATHTAQPLPDRNLVVLNSEALNERCREPVNFAGLVDVADPSDPTLISLFPTPQPPPGYGASSFCSKGGRFGPHNQHQPQGQPCLEPVTDYIYLTYFNAGLQVYDVRDSYDPRIAGYYIPDDPPTRRGPLPTDLVTQVEDVVVDRRGYAYISEKNSGVTVLRFRPEAAAGQR